MKGRFHPFSDSHLGQRAPGV